MRISDWSSDVCSSDLAESELVALLEWAASSGDLLSRIGAIETGLAVLPRIPSLEPTILALVTSIRDLDPTDVEGRLHFLMGILLYVGGDNSRTGVLADLPQFQRRLARKSVAKGKSVVVRVDLGGRWLIKKKKK